MAAAAAVAAGAIGGAYIQSRAHGKAVKAQQSAAEKAIAYERERAAEEKAERKAAAINWQKRYDAYIDRFFGGGGGGGGAAAATPSFASGPGPVAGSGASIGSLIQNMGQLQSDSALASGDMWGNTLTQAGAGIGKAIADRPVSPQATLTGEMQPTGVARPGLSPWQPAPMPRGPQNDWSNWQRYYGNPGL